jgi:hypothetical protein
MIFTIGRVIVPIALLAASSTVGVTGSTARIATVIISGTVSESQSKQPVSDAVIYDHKINYYPKDIPNPS